ncbi:protein kinase domain-containing protein [Micromonospora sp. NPDC004704]
MLSRGIVLSGRYQLNERVATGGMGDVWWGTDVLLRRKVAVKVLLPALVSDAEFITRFRTEARMMAALRHPGIVQIYDYGEDAVVDGRRVDYLVMEYIEGVPLSTWIRETAELDVAQAMSIVTQAAQALHVAHTAGIVHRDVKPSNLLVQPDGSVVLVDFGVARSANLTSITATNMVLGSAHYMAPEQAAGRPVSAATDIYALGAVAYCCLTGRPPFTGDNPIEVVTRHLQEEPPALPEEIPAAVAALVSRALAKAPADRFPTAAAFADAARATQGTAPLSLPIGAADNSTTVPSAPPADPPPPSAPVAMPAAGGNRRRNLLLGGVAAAVVIGLVSLVALLPSSPDENPAPTQPVANVPVEASAAGADPAPPVEATAPATGGASRPAVTPGRATAPATAPPTTGPTTPASPKPSTKTTRAPAAGNPHTPVEVCGSGYQIVDSATLTGTDGTQYGKVYLLYHNGNGYNCTVTMKTTSVGTGSAVSAYLEVQGRPRSTDSGSFAYYAGPVRAQAAGTCVKWGGSAGGASYNSPFEHCS